VVQTDLEEKKELEKEKEKFSWKSFAKKNRCFLANSGAADCCALT
jgi:hypothetical protein